MFCYYFGLKDADSIESSKNIMLPFILISHTYHTIKNSLSHLQEHKNIAISTHSLAHKLLCNLGYWVPKLKPQWVKKEKVEGFENPSYSKTSESIDKYSKKKFDI